MRVLIGEDYDPADGITTRWYHDTASGKVIVQVLQDVESNLKANLAERNQHSAKARFNKAEGLGNKVASIPFAIAEKWMKEDGFNVFTATDAQLRRRLNDSDWRSLRTDNRRL